VRLRVNWDGHRLALGEQVEVRTVGMHAFESAARDPRAAAITSCTVQDATTDFDPDEIFSLADPGEAMLRMLLRSYGEAGSAGIKVWAV